MHSFMQILMVIEPNVFKVTKPREPELIMIIVQQIIAAPVSL